MGGAGGVAPGGGVAYWALHCSGDRLEFWHAGVQTALWAEPCRRVGVFLDRPTGALCFHRATGAMETLHRVRADFHRPLHAALIFEHAAGDAAEFVPADGAQTSLTRIPPDSPEQEGA
ncbi:unnamed protein product [Menidia menidia]|uniref:(Atlantic silverside) hypothetical protein n=1 Tax=Menidia menidia TaxID=238744 RepID=A0A8S4BB12_9TELE|nr:unnamed protein product [Menidia menidia]